MKDMISVELLKQMRIHVGYSQQDLAKATGYSRSYISKIEQGTVEASSIVQWHILQACKRAGMEDWQFAILRIVVDGNEKDLEELLNGINRKAEKMLQSENLHESKPMMIHWLSEIYQEVADTTFTYQVGYKLPHVQNHIPTYRKYAMKHKAKALAAIQEIMCELRSRHMNFNRVNQLITALIATNLYSANAQGKLTGFKLTVGKMQYTEITI